MKKILSALFLLAVVMTAANAQVKFGVTGGLTVNKLSLSSGLKDAGATAKNAGGWFAGPKLYLTVPLVGLGVDGALLYTERKAKITAGGVEENKTMRSFEIPINFRYSIGLSTLASVYLTTGPQFEFNLGNKNWYSGLSTIPDMRTKDATLSWNIGAGIRTLSHLEVGIGYNFGVGKTAEMVNDLTGTYSGKFSTRASSFVIQATYVF